MDGKLYFHSRLVIFGQIVGQPAPWVYDFLDMLDNTTYKLQQLFFEYTNCLIYAQNEELDRRIGT